MSSIAVSGEVIIPAPQSGTNFLSFVEYSYVTGYPYVVLYPSGPVKSIGKITNTTISQEAVMAEYKTKYVGESMTYSN